jgi:phosphoribosylaminoimidazolecarboxamide formyltransferase/IMP cyclohydrolase
LYQEADSLVPEQIEFTPVSDVKPTPEQLEDLKFAWRCVKHVKSNAITVAKGQKLLGMGSGQPNRVKSVQIALEKAADEVEGSVLASDAFFPFSWNDSVEIACKAGVKAIVHPGGSMRDQDAVDCCNKYGVALVTTGVRHFRH